jgi:hypothetical protein
MRMMGEIMAILAPFLSLASIHSASKVLNMITLILDQCFKTLDMVKVLVGRRKLVAMLPKYDNNFVALLDCCLSFFES